MISETTASHAPNLAASAPHLINVFPEQQPDVSVIVVVHNEDEYLKQAFDSILAQDGVQVETVVVCNEPTAASLEIVNAYAAENSGFIVEVQGNTGPSGGRNTGMKLANGRYLMFLDGDDFLEGNQLQQLVQIADQDNLDLVSFDSASYRDDSASDSDWEKFKSYGTMRYKYDKPVPGVELMAQMRLNGEYQTVVWKYLIRRDLALRLGPSPHIMVQRHSDDLFTFSVYLEAARSLHVPLVFHRRRVRAQSLSTAIDQINLNASSDGYLVGYVEALKKVAPLDLPVELFNPIASIVDGLLQAYFRDLAAVNPASRTDIDRLFRKDYPDIFGVILARFIKRYDSQGSANPPTHSGLTAIVIRICERFHIPTARLSRIYRRTAARFAHPLARLKTLAK